MIVSKAFVRYIWVVLFAIFLLIVVGSVVRTTQSGMGCPDWPTCFGNIVPPTDSMQVVFQPNHAYKKGQFIIHNDSLIYSLYSFKSSTVYNPENWKQYEKHNYAKFSVIHTWIEYINRLLGALLGLLILIQVIWSLFYIRKKSSIFWLSLLLVLITGFQAWLGKTVVDSNLALLKITAHMFGALAMVFVSQYLLYIVKGKQTVTTTKKMQALNLILGLLVVIQIIFGTVVRGEIDNINEKLSYINRSGWLALLDTWFYIHRSFSLFIATISIYLTFNSVAFPNLNILAKRVLIVIVLEIVAGGIFIFADFPRLIQPVHLLFSSLLIALIFDNALKLKVRK